ncbi:MAG: RNA polymerase sigma factor [Gammaproteobacteria bacterium]
MSQQPKNHAPSSAPPLEQEAKPRDGAAAGAWKFRLLVVRHYQAVYRLAYSLLRDSHEAEDVVQEVFTRFWQHDTRVKKPKNWLMRVARNLCIDRLRVAGRYVESEEELWSDEGNGDGNPERSYERQNLGERLERAIALLPEVQQSLVILYEVQGMSGKDCAEILGISLNQVKVYLHRARLRLRSNLERPDEVE